MAKQSGNTLIIDTREDVLEELELLDVDELVKKVRDADLNTEYLLIEKLITFADVPGYGKCCTYSTDEKNSTDAYSKKSLEKRSQKNYLFYKTAKEISKYEHSKRNEKIFFNQTKQTNIHMPLEFYTFIGRKDSREEKNYDINNGDVHYYIVNSTFCETFAEKITNDTFEKLDREKKLKPIR